MEEKLRPKRKKRSFPRFNIEPVRSNPKWATIFLMYRYAKDVNGNHVRLKYSLGEKVEVKKWIPYPVQRIKESTIGALEINRINELLDNVKHECMRIARDTPHISVDNFRQELDYFLGNDIRPEPLKAPSFFEFIDSYLEEQKPIMNTGQYRKFKVVFGHLKKYGLTTDRGVLDYEDIDMVFKDRFVQYLITKTKAKSTNTHSRIIKNIKQLMTIAKEHTFINEHNQKVPYHSNDIINNKRFAIKEVATSKHPLTFQEREQLYLYKKFKDNESLQQAKDCFAFMCYSGVRISDLFRISKKNIVTQGTKKYIQLYTYKGRNNKDNEIFIPLKGEVKQILQKYDFKLPKISDQKLNDYIKDIGKAVGLNRKVLDKSGVKNEEPKELELWQTMSNHTGRFTYISIAINDLGVKPQDLQRITGQSLPILMSYVRGDKKKAVDRAAATIELESTKKKIRKVL